MAEDPVRKSPQEVDALVRDHGYVHVDVRTEAEWSAGHPAGALNVPSMLAGPSGMVENPDFVPVMTALFAKDARLVLGCKTGRRSLNAARALLAAGFTDVVDQRAGFEGARDPFGKVVEPGWAAAGLPTEKETPGAAYPELKEKAGKR